MEKSVLLVGALQQAIARFDVAAEGIDEGRYAKEIGVVVVELSLRTDDARVVDIVKGGEERDVEVCKAKRRRVPRGMLTAPPRIASFAQIPFCRNSGKRPTVKGRSKLASLPVKPEYREPTSPSKKSVCGSSVELEVEFVVAVAAAELEAGEFTCPSEAA